MKGLGGAMTIGEFNSVTQEEIASHMIKKYGARGLGGDYIKQNYESTLDSKLESPMKTGTT